MSVITCRALDSPEQMVLLAQRGPGLPVGVGSDTEREGEEEAIGHICRKADLIRPTEQHV